MMSMTLGNSAVDLVGSLNKSSLNTYTYWVCSVHKCIAVAIYTYSLHLC